MKRTISVTTLIVICIAFLAPGVFAVPKLYIEDPTFDFGFAPQQSKISHTFWLKSVGDDTLKILRVNPG
jgi:hypothetical protein